MNKNPCKKLCHQLSKPALINLHCDELRKLVLVMEINNGKKFFQEWKSESNLVCMNSK